MEIGFAFQRAGEVRAFLEKAQESERQIPTWKYAFSDRVLMADAFREMLEALRREAAAEGRPWSEVRPVKGAIERELQASRNPLTSFVFEHFIGFRHLPPNDPVRDRRAQLRLLRVAVHWLATGEVQDLEDPFGTILRNQQQGTLLRIWSVGSDGVDHGGNGSWKPASGKDIVLEVNR
jgi:hypothetical protein